MIAGIKALIGRNRNNIPGWKTSRKIIVIESDDWGTVRMPSAAVYDTLIKEGIALNKCGFCSNDSLASEEDLKKLFAVLTKHKNKAGKSPVITANVITSNPVFDKIEASGFNEYHHEVFTETLKRYPEHSNSFELWKKGISAGIFHPQLHGREHVNINRWMQFLRDGSAETLTAFSHKMFGISTNVTKEKRKSYMPAFDYEKPEELRQLKDIVTEAQHIFTELFGFRSKSFIAPNYTWSPELEGTLKDLGVEYIQGARGQVLPVAEATGVKTIRHITGQKNKHGQIYLVRNCYFEPSTLSKADPVDDCMRQIESAFFWKNPAIIGSHRVNFIGFVNPANREKNLEMFDRLLTRIIKKWPDVEFMTSDQLGDLIKKVK